MVRRNGSLRAALRGTVVSILEFPEPHIDIR